VLNRRILGVFGRAQELYDFALHALVFLSNHWHALFSFSDLEPSGLVICWKGGRLGTAAGGAGCAVSETAEVRSSWTAGAGLLNRRTEGHSMIPGRGSLLVAAPCVAAALLVACSQAEIAPSGEPSVAALVETLMKDLHERGLFNGAVVVGRGDEILYERGFGPANVAEDVPFTPTTPSNGASIGKTLTAAAILMLQEDGRIDLDDPVTEYLSEFPYPEITVRHLISHRSGLHPDGVYFTFLAPEVEPQTNEGLLEVLVEHTPPLAFRGAASCTAERASSWPPC
jgi:hypothetical protein